MSRLAALWQRKFLLLGLVAALIICAFLSPGSETAAEVCRKSDVAARNYEDTVSSNYLIRLSGRYITTADALDMQRREEAAAQIAGTMQLVCEHKRHWEADSAEMADLQTRFDVSRFYGYTIDQRRAVLKAAGLLDSLAIPPSLSSFDGKLALLRAFRDHPDLYH